MSLRLALAPLLASLLLCTLGLAQTHCPDAFEPNDDCASATVVATSTLSTQIFLTPAGPDHDPDFFRFTVGPNETLEANCHGLLHPSPAMDLEVLAADCVTVLAADSLEVFWSNTGAQPVDVILRLEGPPVLSVPCELCQLTVEIYVDPCIVLQPDLFEPNDTWATASPIAAGSTWRLSLPRNDVDFYRIPVPIGSIVQVDVRSQDGLGSPPGVQAELFGLAGGHLPPADASGSGAVMNLTDDDEVLLRCRTHECAFYSIHVQVTASPCTGIVSDMFEDNDDFQSAAYLPRGEWPNLNVHHFDQDYYYLPLLADEVALVGATWDPATHAGVRLIAYDPTGNLVSIDQGHDGTSVVAMRNDTGAPAQYVVRASPAIGVPAGFPPCVEYDLTARYRQTSLGAVVCSGTSDPSDPGTELLLIGSADVGDLRLVAWTERGGNSAAEVTPTLLAGNALDPRVVQGVTVCVGGSLGYRVVPSNAFGESYAVTVDLLGPQATPFLGALSGTTWVFQFVRSEFGGGLDWSSDARSLTFL